MALGGFLDIASRLAGGLATKAVIALAYPLARTIGLAVNELLKQPGPLGDNYRAIFDNPTFKTIAGILGPAGPNFWRAAAYRDFEDALDGWSQSLSGTPLGEIHDVIEAAEKGDIVGVFDSILEFAVDHYQVDEVAALTRGMAAALAGLKDVVGIDPSATMAFMAGLMTWLVDAIEGLLDPKGPKFPKLDIEDDVARFRRLLGVEDPSPAEVKKERRKLARKEKRKLPTKEDPPTPPTPTPIPHGMTENQFLQHLREEGRHAHPHPPPRPPPTMEEDLKSVVKTAKTFRKLVPWGDLRKIVGELKKRLKR